MIEVSITEIVLFAWAIVATGYAYKYKHDADKSNGFIRIILEDDSAREKIVAGFKQFKQEEQNAN